MVKLDKYVLKENTIIFGKQSHLKTTWKGHTFFGKCVDYSLLLYFTWTNTHEIFDGICCKPSKAAAEKATEKASAAAENALSSAQELQKEMASIWQACWPVGPRRYFWKGSEENRIIGETPWKVTTDFDWKLTIFCQKRFATLIFAGDIRNCNRTLIGFFFGLNCWRCFWFKSLQKKFLKIYRIHRGEQKQHHLFV